MKNVKGLIFGAGVLGSAFVSLGWWCPGCVQEHPDGEDCPHGYKSIPRGADLDTINKILDHNTAIRLHEIEEAARRAAREVRAPITSEPDMGLYLRTFYKEMKKRFPQHFPSHGTFWVSCQGYDPFCDDCQQGGCGCGYNCGYGCDWYNSGYGCGYGCSYDPYYDCGGYGSQSSMSSYGCDWYNSGYGCGYGCNYNPYYDCVDYGSQSSRSSYGCGSWNSGYGCRW